MSRSGSRPELPEFSTSWQRWKTNEREFWMYQQGHIDSSEKTVRLEKIERERQMLQDVLARETPNTVHLTLEDLRTDCRIL
jgi:hypothetical protein